MSNFYCSHCFTFKFFKIGKNKELRKHEIFGVFFLPKHSWQKNGHLYFHNGKDNKFLSLFLIVVQQEPPDRKCLFNFLPPFPHNVKFYLGANIKKMWAKLAVTKISLIFKLFMFAPCPGLFWYFIYYILQFHLVYYSIAKWITWPIF